MISLFETEFGLFFGAWNPKFLLLACEPTAFVKAIVCDNFGFAIAAARWSNYCFVQTMLVRAMRFDCEAGRSEMAELWQSALYDYETAASLLR